jgi:hypothetical protein
LFGLSILAIVSGVASFLGALGAAAAVFVVSLMAVGQLLAAWLHYRWLRAERPAT